MLVKTVKYIDYNGNQQEETLYFNLTKAEIAQMQVRMNGRFIDHLKELVAGKKVEELFSTFQDIILDSYGEKSSDGKRFIKTPEMRKDFASSIAYSEILTELLQDPKQSRAFTRAILPPDFQNVEIPENIVSSDEPSAALNAPKT